MSAPGEVKGMSVVDYDAMADGVVRSMSALLDRKLAKVHAQWLDEFIRNHHHRQHQDSAAGIKELTDISSALVAKVRDLEERLKRAESIAERALGLIGSR